VIPGGDGLRRSLVSETIADWVLARNETRRVVAVAVDYGVAPTGLLDGREITTHWLTLAMLHVFPNLRVDPEGISLKMALLHFFRS